MVWMPSLYLIGLAVCLEPPPGARSARQYDRAVIQTLQKFDHYDTVAIGEQHWSVEQHEFLEALLLHPRFPDTVRTIVVEFGNAAHQQDLDDYLSLQATDDSIIRRVLTSGSQVAAWDGEVYENFFRTVRRLNSALDARKRVRVLVGEPPIDWTRIRSADEFRRWHEHNSRRTFMNSLRESSTISGNRTLWIAGTGHIRRREGERSDDSPLYRTGIHNSRTEPSLPAILPDSLPRLIDFRTEGAFAGLRTEDGPLSAGFDGYYYLKPHDELTSCGMMRGLYSDPAFVAEIKRRWRILRDAGMVDEELSDTYFRQGSIPEQP